MDELSRRRWIRAYTSRWTLCWWISCSCNQNIKQSIKINWISINEMEFRDEFKIIIIIQQIDILSKYVHTCLICLKRSKHVYWTLCYLLCFIIAMEFRIWWKLLNASEVVADDDANADQTEKDTHTYIHFIGKSFANDHVVCSLQ